MIGFALVASQLVTKIIIARNKNNNAIVSSIKFDSCYLLTKGANGVKAKFVGTSMLGPKKKVIWVPKNLVTNLQGLK
jgi:hypothetical protein